MLGNGHIYIRLRLGLTHHTALKDCYIFYNILLILCPATIAIFSFQGTLFYNTNLSSILECAIQNSTLKAQDKAYIAHLQSATF